MIGVVIPAYNEEFYLPACLQAIQLAAHYPLLHGEDVRVVVVLDSCTDGSQEIVQLYGFEALSVAVKNVGGARAAGADVLLAAGARWLAFTDADTVVSPAWLYAQLSLQAAVVCGVVQVDDWSSHGQHAGFLQQYFANTYQDKEGHRHIHGANLGLSAQAYIKSGGFAALACSEDVALIEALCRHNIEIAWSAIPRVITSARTDARARGGFGDTLLGTYSGLGLSSIE